MNPERIVYVDPATGQIDADQLAGLDPNLVAQLVNAAPYLRVRQKTGRRESRLTHSLIPCDYFTRGIARNIAKPRRPEGMSGRQWRIARKLANKCVVDSSSSGDNL